MYLKSKFSFVNLLNSGDSNISIMTMISKFLSNSINFCVIVSFLTKLLTLGILFSTALRVVLARLVVLGISPLTSFILALRVVLIAELVISGLLSLIFSAS